MNSKRLHDYLDGGHNELLRRSLFGLPQVYNKLPQKTVDQPTVKAFQRELQRLVQKDLRAGRDDWENRLNLRKVSFAVRTT